MATGLAVGFPSDRQEFTLVSESLSTPTIERPSFEIELFGFEIELEKPYSTNYSQCLDEAKRDQRQAARPRIQSQVANIAQYETIFLGYPNWWATIPMPIASFLESYDLSGKRIAPFCSHGGGRLGQSVTDISKLAPNSEVCEGLSVHYRGGSNLEENIDHWLRANALI